MAPCGGSQGHLTLGRLESGVMNKTAAAYAEGVRAAARRGNPVASVPGHDTAARRQHTPYPGLRGAGRRRGNGAARGERVAGVLSHTGCGPMDGARGEATLRIARVLRAVRPLDESDPVGAGALAGGVGSPSVWRECQSDGCGNDANLLASAPGHTG